MYLATAHQIRQADQIQIKEKQYPGLLLMEQAGRLCAEWLLTHFPDRPAFLIVAGSGNNGGDGLVIARYLHQAGKRVDLMLAHQDIRFQVDALINYRIVEHMPISVHFYDAGKVQVLWDTYAQQPVVVDALLGTGISQAVRAPIGPLMEEIRNLEAEVIAIDLPSGLNASSGQLLSEPLKAYATLTFQVPKICHYVYPAAEYCGEIVVLDIGLWPEVMEQLGIERQVLTQTLISSWLKPRKKNEHKGSYGHVLVVGGSERMCGAIGLTALAGMKAGAGLCTVLTPEPCRQTVLNLVPEAMVVHQEGGHLNRQSTNYFETILKGKHAVVLGPGLGRTESTIRFLREIIPLIKVPLVLDADALNLIAQYEDLWSSMPRETVLTPHPGEMRRLSLFEQINDQRLEVAEQFAHQRNTTLVLKGAGTIVALPSGKSYINTSGNPGMGTAGSGDVLAGIIGGLLAQGYSTSEAACVGVYLHGLAGDLAAKELGEGPLMARDILAHWPAALATV